MSPPGISCTGFEIRLETASATDYMDKTLPWATILLIFSCIPDYCLRLLYLSEATKKSFVATTKPNSTTTTEKKNDGDGGGNEYRLVKSQAEELFFFSGRLGPRLLCVAGWLAGGSVSRLIGPSHNNHDMTLTSLFSVVRSLHDYAAAAVGVSTD